MISFKDLQGQSLGLIVAAENGKKIQHVVSFDEFGSSSYFTVTDSKGRQESFIRIREAIKFFNKL